MPPPPPPSIQRKQSAPEISVAPPVPHSIERKQSAPDVLVPPSVSKRMQSRPSFGRPNLQKQSRVATSRATPTIPTSRPSPSNQPVLPKSRPIKRNSNPNIDTSKRSDLIDGTVARNNAVIPKLMGPEISVTANSTTASSSICNLPPPPAELYDDIYEIPPPLPVTQPSQNLIGNTYEVPPAGPPPPGPPPPLTELSTVAPKKTLATSLIERRKSLTRAQTVSEPTQSKPDFLGEIKKGNFGLKPVEG